MAPAAPRVRARRTAILAAAGAAFALVLLIAAAAVALPGVTGLDSATHPVPMTWYSDDSPQFAWDDTYPSAMGSAGTPGAAVDIAVSGDAAYVADVADGLHVFDISEPGTPTAHGDLDYSETTYGLDVAGDMAYLVGPSFGLRTIDVSDPASPTALDSAVASGTPWDVTAVGHVAYVSVREAGVATFDISEPATLTALGRYDTPGTALGVAFAGGVAHVADGEAGLLTLDASDPGTLTPLATLDTSGTAYDIALSGLTAYVADGSAGLLAVDVSYPGTPTILGSIDTSGSAYKVAVLGDLAYVADGADGVTAVDVSDPSAMRILGRRPMGDVAYSIALGGGTCFVAGGTAGLETVRISEPVDVTLLDTEPSNYAAYVDVQGDTLHIADWGSLYMLDVSDPASMTPYYWYASDGSYTCTVDGNIAYVANGWSGVRLIDVSDPMNPTQISLFDTPDYATRVAVSGNIAYFADFRAGVHAVDVSDPANPVLLDTYNTPGYAYAVHAVGTTVWVGDYQAGIRALDASDPTNLTSLGSYDTPGNSYDIELEGDVAYVADVGGGLRVFDVSDPASITPIAQRTLAGAAWDVSAQGDQLAVADDTGISILDISDPTSPTVTSSLATPGRSVAVDTDGDVAYIGDQTSGVHSYQISDYWTGSTRVFDATPTTDPPTSGGDAATSASYPDTADGEWYFHVRSVGRFGTAGTTEHRMVRIDTTEPRPRPRPLRADGRSTDAPVSIEATDALSGVATTEYSLNGGPAASYAGTFTVSAEGTTTVGYRSADVAGNLEGTQTVEVLIDKTPPVTMADVVLPPPAPATIDLAATDALSGVAQTYYTFGSGVMTGTAVSVTTPGPYTLQYWSVDHAGNIETTRTLEYTGEVEVVRRGGRDRYAVAVDASRSNFASSDHVVLATGWTYADALSASGLAGCLEAPILVTLQDRLPANVEAEIKRLGADKVTIVGGPYSVQPQIEKRLRDVLGLDVERIGGSDRYVVSNAIAQRVRAFGSDGGRVFIASGEVGADALSLSPLVYSAKAPLILTRRNVVPTPSERALRSGTTGVAVLAGGPVTVTDANIKRMERMTGTPIERLWGQDRYDTAAAVARYGVASGVSLIRLRRSSQRGRRRSSPTRCVVGLRWDTRRRHDADAEGRSARFDTQRAHERQGHRGAGSGVWRAQVGGRRRRHSNQGHLRVAGTLICAGRRARHQRIALLEEESYLNMVQMLAVAADARDPYTQRHSRDVADFAILLAEDLGFDAERIALLKTAALLHDVGKIGIRDSILKKPGRLSEEEYRLVQGHPELAVHILGSIPRKEILPWILSHHEHWDGGGYPEGLAGATAPLEARILALCDAYDAMTTDRPYRGSMSHAEACEELLADEPHEPQCACAQRAQEQQHEHRDERLGPPPLVRRVIGEVASQHHHLLRLRLRHRHPRSHRPHRPQTTCYRRRRRPRRFACRRPRWRWVSRSRTPKRPSTTSRRYRGSRRSPARRRAAVRRPCRRSRRRQRSRGSAPRARSTQAASRRAARSPRGSARVPRTERGARLLPGCGDPCCATSRRCR